MNTTGLYSLLPEKISKKKSYSRLHPFVGIILTDNTNSNNNDGEIVLGTKKQADSFE